MNKQDMYRQMGWFVWCDKTGCPTRFVKISQCLIDKKEITGLIEWNTDKHGSGFCKNRRGTYMVMMREIKKILQEEVLHG
jgi:hypothetical protein